MNPTSRAVVVAATLSLLAAPVAADPVTDWIDRTVALGYRAAVTPVINSRNVAMVAVAIFDALNAITPRYAPYRAPVVAARGASGDAAVAAAAHFLLVRFYPEFAGEVDAAFRAALAAIPAGTPQTEGVRLGESVAARLFEERRDDETVAAGTYRPFTTAGTYVPTVLPLAPGWGSAKPFGLRAASQFRPGAPYALTSPQWAADFDEVRRLGALTGSQRTAEQTEIARFWAFTGPGTYMPVARQLAAARRLEPLESARIHALVAMAAADALIAVFDAKYTYNFWRPVTAIRNGDLDGNDATARDPGWEPFIATPLHPEYPCAHCITQGAVASVLAAALGDSAAAFTLTSPTAPGVTRRYARLADYAAEVIDARVYDGVHYRTSGNVGAAMGRQIGEYLAEHLLRPAPR